MKKLIPITLLLLLSLSAKKSYATHMAGCDITYECIDTLKFEFSLTWYRDCGGIALNNAGQVTVRCGSTTRNVTLTLSSITDITPLCATASTGCSPSNTTGTGAGIEKHVYKGILDFNTTPLSSFASCSGNVIVGASINARNGAITTGPSGNLYNDVEIDLQKAPTNSSPRFTNEAVGILCCNQPFFYNLGASDTSDLDSLSYRFASARNGYGQNVTYSGSFSYQNPITAYYPGTLSYPYNNPGASPPIGIYLDPLTGDFIVTPTNCSEVAVVVIEVTEWRNDTNGVAQIIGKNTREVQLIVKSCPNNNPPEIDGPFSYNVCEGDQLCFNITTDDRVFVPPPPASRPAPDTTRLFWNNGIPGATFSILNSSARLKTGRFCWTPPYGSASTLPYTFTARVEDNACPLKGEARRMFRVRVKKRAESQLTITKISNDIYVVENQIDSTTFKGNPSYLITVSDSTNVLIFDTTIVKFNSTNSFLTTQDKDTVRINRNTIFHIQSMINNSPINCPGTYYDTLQVDSVLQTLIDFADDTLICAGTSIVLNTTTTYAKGPPSYQWYENDTTLLTGDTLSSLALLDLPRLLDNSYTVRVTDSTGKINQDKVRIRTKDNFDNNFEEVYSTCLGDSIVLELDSLFSTILWSDGSTDSLRSFTQEGSPWVSYSDSFTCEYSDTPNIIINPLPVTHLEDSTTCEASMTLTAGTFASYAWNVGLSNETITINTTGDYAILVTDSNGCQNRDTAHITIWNAQEVDLGNDSSQCGGSIPLANNIMSSQLWNTGAITSSISVSSTGEYSIVTTDTNGCQSRDTISIDIYTLPSQDWADTIAYCSDTAVLLTSKSFDTYLWNTGDTTQSVSLNTSGMYSLYFEDNQGCSNTDSVYVNIHSLPNIELGNDTAFCGDSLLLALAPGNSYAWSNGDTLNYTTINTSGDYSISVTDSNGCSSSDTVNVTFNSNTNVPTLTRVGDSIASSLIGTHYWFLDNVATTDANANVIGIDGRIGSFTAVYQDTNGCISDTSNSILRTLGIGKLSSSPLKVYPNPSNGKVTIDLEGLGALRSIKIYDNQGKLVDSEQQLSGTQVILKWTARSGVFWLEVETDKGLYREQIIAIK
jgi:hypothetical protein